MEAALSRSLGARMPPMTRRSIVSSPLPQLISRNRCIARRAFLVDALPRPSAGNDIRRQFTSTARRCKQVVSQSQHPQTQEAPQRAAAEPLPSLDEALSLPNLLSQEGPPDDELVVEHLQKFKETAARLQDVPSPKTRRVAQGSARKLLQLDENDRARGSAKERSIDQLSITLYKFIKQPKVFLSPQVLELYVQIQSILKRPESFPEIFQLYANKPIPLRRTSPVRYKDNKPNRLASAIPARAASQALQAAIETRILPLCLDVIESSVCTTAYRRRKMIQKMWVPGAVLALTPPVAWLLALSFDQWQITLTSRYARTAAFAGFASYIGFTGILGYVALTTANDHMERVTWRDGIPLTTRWLREDERAMMDQVAVAWGFKDKLRRGEEEGPEWEALKELMSMRDMILDRVNLMEGFE